MKKLRFDFPVKKNASLFLIVSDTNTTHRFGNAFLNVLNAHKHWVDKKSSFIESIGF